MIIKQKKSSNRTKFEFGDDEFKYSFADRRVSLDISIKYAQFPKSANKREERNEWLRNAGVFWILFGSAFFLTAVVNGESYVGKLFWIVLGGVCLAYYNYSATRYSVFPTEAGTVFIIRDQKHDDIVKEIMSRKKKLLLSWYGGIDYENEPEYEIQKFNWLRDQGALTDEEAKLKIDQVRWVSKI